jgi:hypothetical protein
MNILITIIIILCILFLFVVYQGRNEQVTFKEYLSRLNRLIILIFVYFKEVGLCAADKFRQMDWHLNPSKRRPNIPVKQT